MWCICFLTYINGRFISDNVRGARYLSNFHCIEKDMDGESGSLFEKQRRALSEKQRMKREKSTGMVVRTDVAREEAAHFLTDEEADEPAFCHGTSEQDGTRQQYSDGSF
ncbi:putative zinc protease PqqL [Trichinella pseudospiralis]